MDELAIAKRIDANIQEIAQRKNKLNAVLARLLSDLEDEDRYALLGHSSVAAYAEHVLGFSRRKTRDMITLGRRLRKQPLISEDFGEGRLPWTKARAIAEAVELEPEKEAEWRERGRTHTARDLEMALSSMKGEDTPIRLTLTLTPEEHAEIVDAARAYMKERQGEDISFHRAVAEVCRRAVTGGDHPVGGPRHRIVLHVCAECKRATREGPDGPVVVDPRVAEAAACHTEVLDAREGPATLVRVPPPRVVNFVYQRDRGRCRVPLCRNRTFLNIHHEGGWLRVGHDPRFLFLMCDKHHAARHRCDFTIDFVAPGVVQFQFADGKPFGPPVRLDDPPIPDPPHGGGGSREPATASDEQPIGASESPPASSSAATRAPP